MSWLISKKKKRAKLELDNVHSLKKWMPTTIWKTELLSVQEEKEKEWYFIENEKLENQESQPSDYSFHLYGRGGNNKIRNILMVTVGTTHMTQYSLFNSLKLSSLDLQFHRKKILLHSADHFAFSWLS